MMDVRGQHYSDGTINGIIRASDERMRKEISRRALVHLVWAAALVGAFLAIHHGII